MKVIFINDCLLHGKKMYTAIKGFNNDRQNRLAGLGKEGCQKYTRGTQINYRMAVM